MASRTKARKLLFRSGINTIVQRILTNQKSVRDPKYAAMKYLLDEQLAKDRQLLAAAQKKRQSRWKNSARAILAPRAAVRLHQTKAQRAEKQQYLEARAKLDKMDLAESMHRRRFMSENERAIHEVSEFNRAYQRKQAEKKIEQYEKKRRVKSPQ